MGKLSSKPIGEWTFETDDKLGLKEFAARLQSYLNVDHHFASSSLVISLDAPFGSGKTTFLSMWKNYLTAQREQADNKPLPVLINAWEDDFCGEPLLSLVLSLIESVKDDSSGDSSTTVQKLTTAVTAVAWFALGLGNSVAKKFTGLDPVSAGKLAEEKTAGPPTEEIPDVVRLFEYRQSAIASLKACLSETFGGDDVQAIIIVDELDRCRPDYAVAFLETIKHIFDLPGVVFVLAIDRDQLASSTKALFGSDLNASEYLRKFISRSFELPNPNDAGIRQFVGHQVKRFMTLPDVRASSFDSSNLGSRAVELCVDLQLTLRQIEELFRVMGHVFSTQQENKQVYSSWSLGILLLCSLKVRDNEIYRAIGKQSLSTQDFVRHLLDFMSDDQAFYWGSLYHTGRSRGDQHDTFEQIWSSVDKSKAPSFSGPSDLEKHFRQHWGHVGADHIQRIYEWIETAATV